MNLPRGRPFPPGNPGGPGRPKGSRNRVSKAQRVLEEHSEAIVRKCVIQALKGEPTAMRLCLERIVPVRREPSVKLKLGPTQTMQPLPLIVEVPVAPDGEFDSTNRVDRTTVALKTASTLKRFGDA